MKHVERILIVLLTITTVFFFIQWQNVKKSYVAPSEYVMKDKIRSYAVRHGLPTSFLRDVFPEEVVYYDNGEIVFEPVDKELNLHHYDWALLNWEGNQVTYPDTYQGVDVSSFSQDIDWYAVKEAGIHFAMVRVGYRGYTQGSLNVDDYFHQNAKGCNDAGVKLGAYFFSQAISVPEAIEEASFVISLLKDYKVDYPVCFDMEELGENARANNLTKEEVTKITIAFCNTIKEAGYTPMIYANSHWIFSKLDLEQVKDIDKWYAQYASEPYYPYEMTMWQYTESGSVPGISNAADRNISFIDY